MHKNARLNAICRRKLSGGGRRPYSRLPLWRGEPENIVGVLHARDLLRALNAAGGDVRNFKVESIARNPGSCRIRLRCKISSRRS